MACCGDSFGALEADDDAYSIIPDDSEEEEKRIQTPFNKAPPLFREIEKLNWEYVLLFLKKGKWADSFFTSSSTSHLENADPATQARTWVEEDGFCQLPIHAAVSLNAPFVVIQNLINVYPDSVRMRNSRGYLPLHIAYRLETPDTVISTLLEAWPDAALEKNQQGLTPHETARSTHRAKIISITMGELRKVNALEKEKQWKPLVQAESEALGLQIGDATTLPAVLKQLMDDRKQLIHMKAQLKKSYSNEGPTGGSNEGPTGGSSSKSSSIFSRRTKDEAKGNNMERLFSKHKSRIGNKKNGRLELDEITMLSGATEQQKNPRSKLATNGRVQPE